LKAAYIDTSLLVAVHFAEPHAEKWAAGVLREFQLFSSNLLEAEIRAAYWREQVRFDESALACIHWVLPKRGLRDEFDQVLATGYLRGADMWHVATALYLRERSDDLFFATLDARQARVASALGFRIVALEDVQQPAP